MRHGDMPTAAVPRGVREAYEESGYESPEAHMAELEAMLDAKVGAEVDADERRRLVTEHLRLHADQDAILAAAQIGEIAAEAAIGQLTDVRLRFFDRCDAILGPERFEKLFGGTPDVTKDEVAGLVAAVEKH